MILIASPEISIIDVDSTYRKIWRRFRIKECKTHMRFIKPPRACHRRFLSPLYTLYLRFYMLAKNSSGSILIKIWPGFRDLAPYYRPTAESSSVLARFRSLAQLCRRSELTFYQEVRRSSLCTTIVPAYKPATARTGRADTLIARE